MFVKINCSVESETMLMNVCFVVLNPLICLSF